MACWFNLWHAGLNRPPRSWPKRKREAGPADRDVIKHADHNQSRLTVKRVPEESGQYYYAHVEFVEQAVG